MTTFLSIQISISCHFLLFRKKKNQKVSAKQLSFFSLYCSNHFLPFHQNLKAFFHFTMLINFHSNVDGKNSSIDRINKKKVFSFYSHFLTLMNYYALITKKKSFFFACTASLCLVSSFLIQLS